MDPIRLIPLPTARSGALKPLDEAATKPISTGRGLDGLAKKGPADLPALPPLGGEMRALGDGPEAKRAKVAQAARDFEAVFLGYLSSSMTKGALGGGEMPGAEFYQGMIDEQLGQLLAESGGGLGLHAALSAAMTDPEGDDHVAR